MRIMGRLRAAACGAVLVGAVLGSGTPATAATAYHSERILFDGGGSERLNGITYHSFRIPSLVRTTHDTLLAFVEGRADSNADYGNINLLYKRSTDNGATWSGLREVVGSGLGTWGNPTAVVDRNTGVIWLFMSWNPAGYSQNGDNGTTRITQWDQRRVYLSHSDDDGLTWTGPADMTAALKPALLADGSTWAWDAVGPGVGIQTTVDHPGRLVVPAQFRNLYSDDDGATWQVRRLVDAGTGAYEEQTSEATVLELADGRLYRDDRPTTTSWNAAARRWVARGTIEGGFSAFAPDPTLLDTPCEASDLRYNNDAPARIVFLNSASTVTRTKMRVRISYDEGVTWPISRPLSDAPLPLESTSYQEGGYSSMAKTADYMVGALVEVNEDVNANSTSHRSIAFRKFNLPWMLNGQPEPV